MPTYTEPKYLSDVLLVEVAQGWTKQTQTMAPITAALAIGAVLALNADGKYVPVDFAATDGTEKAVGVLASPAEIATTDQKAVVIERGATVARNQLEFPEGATDEQKATAVAELLALGIVAQDTY